jgi:hypothetical protein
MTNDILMINFGNIIDLSKYNVAGTERRLWKYMAAAQMSDEGDDGDGDLVVTTSVDKAIVGGDSANEQGESCNMADSLSLNYVDLVTIFLIGVD